MAIKLFLTSETLKFKQDMEEGFIIYLFLPGLHMTYREHRPGSKDCCCRTKPCCTGLHHVLSEQPNIVNIGAEGHAGGDQCFPTLFSASASFLNLALVCGMFQYQPDSLNWNIKVKIMLKRRENTKKIIYRTLIVIMKVEL